MDVDEVVSWLRARGEEEGRCVHECMERSCDKDVVEYHRGRRNSFLDAAAILEDGGYKESDAIRRRSVAAYVRRVSR